MLGQTTPLAAMFHHIEQSVDQLQIGQTHVAAPARQAVGDAIELWLGLFLALREYLVGAFG